jgi:hypothetical protein
MIEIEGRDTMRSTKLEEVAALEEPLRDVAELKVPLMAVAANLGRGEAAPPLTVGLTGGVPRVDWLGPRHH